MASFLEENKIPIPFLVTLLMQFALIIIDRAIYLRKYIKGKLVFQILLTLGMHMWLFFALPAMTERLSLITSTTFDTFKTEIFLKEIHITRQFTAKVVLHLQMYLLLVVCLSNKKWLSNKNFRQHFLQKI